MKSHLRSVSLYVVLLCAVFVEVLGVSEAADPRPHVKLSDVSYDFGAVPQGQKITHSFAFKNVGSADLLILGTSPSCGCTVASVSASALKPGETGTLAVEFDTAGFSGPKTKTVDVLTNDKDTPTVTFVLKGTVVAAVAAEPRVLEFGRVSSSGINQLREKALTITQPAGSAYSVSKITSASPFVVVTEAARTETTARYVVSLKPGLPKGPFRDRIVVEFSDKNVAPLNVPIVSFVESDISVKPATISFGVVSGEKILERRVDFRYLANEPLTIKYVSSSDSAVSAYYQPGKRGMDGTIVVRLNPAKVRGNLKATIEISTSYTPEPITYLNVFATTPAS